MSHSKVPGLSAGRIAAGYAVIAILWIAFSDAIVIQLKLPEALMTIKGALFVVVTASLLYFTIRQLVRAIRAAAEQASRLAAIVESSEDAILSKTLDGMIVSWNQGAEKIYGYTAEEVVGKPVSILTAPEVPNEMPQLLSRVARGESVDHYETVRRRKNGTLIPISLALSPIRDSAGRIVGASTVARDISERRRAEQELRESEANLNRAQAIAHIGSWHLDLARNHLTWSDEVFRIFNIARGAALTYEAFLAAVHPEDRETVDRAWAAALRGAPYDIEHRIVVGEESKWVRERAAVEFDTQGKAVEGIGTVQDVTERKHAEAALRASEAERGRAEIALQETRAELERVSRVTTMGALTASIAHEVNQPLVGVVTSANAGLNWLAANPPNLSKTREALERVRRDGTRAGQVLDRIRALLKRTPSAKALLSVNHIINDVLALTAGELRRHRIATDLALAPNPPAILGDAIQLQQVLLNLITNAMDAMAAASVATRTLRIQSSLGEFEGRPAVVVLVSDTGVGFGNTDVPWHFEAFHTTKPHGMGMGLWISRSIIEEHGGRLAAQSNSGPGATFVVTLPAESQVTADKLGASEVTV